MIQGSNDTNLEFEDYIPAAGNASAEGKVSMQDVIRNLRERQKNVLNGGINCIPLPFNRFRSEIPGIEQEQYVVITASTKAGKCFGKGTRVRMADNTIKNIEDICVGDWVMSPGLEGPKQVLGLGNGREQLYRIRSERYDDLVVNENHVMYVYCRSKKREYTTTVGELLKKQSECKTFKHDYRMVASDTCELFQNPTLPVEPYFYGLWLGDGATKDVNITTIDSEIVNYLQEYADRLGMKLSVYLGKNRTNRYAISRKEQKLKGFKGLLGSVCNWQKEHINRDYLNASIDDRFQLLAGLIDTDGYLNRAREGYQITLKNLSLIQDIQELARSLGLSTKIRKKYNRKYDRYYYILLISGKRCAEIPVRLKRKKCKETIKDFRHYSFEIESIGEGDYYGLVLGGNHLFLLEDYTVVHNTQLGSYVYLYSVLDYAFIHRDQCSVHIIYFNLEESESRIKERYISHLLNKYGSMRVSPSNLRSTSADEPLPDEAFDKMNESAIAERLAFFDECIQFESEDTNPTGILRVCEEYAKSVGDYQTVTRRSRGDGKPVQVFKSYKKYDKKHYVITFIDHIGLVDLERGMNLKQSMDKLSEYAVKYLRNRFGMTVVAIQQQAMESEGLEAIKMKKMLPAVATLGDTKYTARDANLVLGLFDPSNFGLPNWLGYKIQDAGGDGLRNYGRFLYVLRGRDGEMGGVCPLFFDGATCDFKELPRPDDINEMNKIYAKVKDLKTKKQQKKAQSLLFVLFNGRKRF